MKETFVKIGKIAAIVLLVALSVAIAGLLWAASANGFVIVLTTLNFLVELAGTFSLARKWFKKDPNSPKE